MMKFSPEALRNWTHAEGIRRALVTGRAFAMLSFGSMLFFLILGIAVTLHQQSSSSPVHSMKGLAASVSSGWFGEMLEMEMPAFQSGLPAESITGKEISVFLMRTLTDINPGNPRSLLAGELPGMPASESYLIRRGIGTDTEVGPRDQPPLYDPLAGLDEEHGTEVTLDEPDELDEPAPGTGAGADSGTDGGAGSGEEAPAKPTTGDAKIAFIYHSHPRESWFPELDEGAKDANSKTRNITLVGKRLADKLEEEGVGAMHSDTDYPTAIPGYRWELSYKYSLKTVKEAMASSSDLKFMFDIHRDSQKRKYTTVDIGGQSYAQVYFIIGQRNPNWKENEAFAARIHEAMEERYPGISRGIWGKTASTGNAEYNQSLSPGSVLLEIGGIENTLEECYRTADALAEVIASIYWEAEKVSAEE